MRIAQSQQKPYKRRGNAGRDGEKRHRRIAQQSRAAQRIARLRRAAEAAQQRRRQQREVRRERERALVDQNVEVLIVRRRDVRGDHASVMRPRQRLQSSQPQRIRPAAEQRALPHQAQTGLPDRDPAWDSLFPPGVCTGRGRI